MSSAPSPALETGLEGGFYADPAIYLRECERIFARAWQIVGHASEWENAGSFRSMMLAGTSLFVVRGKDGILRAFRNMCRHRGSPLVEGQGAACETIRCPYHGWRYGLDGQLLETPWFGEETPFDLSSLFLVPLSIEIWRGLVFVALQPEETLLDQLGGMPELLEDVSLEGMLRLDRRSSVEPINWKTYIDQFTEYYHSPAVHGSDEGVGIDRFTAVPFDRGMVMRAPDGLAFYGLKWLWGWPNWTIATFRGGVKISWITPLSAQESQFHFLFLGDASGAATPAERRRVIDATLAIFAEDAAILRRVQSNLASGSYVPGPLHPRHEQATVYFQQLVRDALSR